jgi:hypothetical protein
MERGGVSSLMLLSLLLGMTLVLCAAMFSGDLPTALLTTSLFPFLLTTAPLRGVPVFPPRRKRWALPFIFTAYDALLYSLGALVFLSLFETLAESTNFFPPLRGANFASARLMLLAMLIAAPLARLVFIKVFRSESGPELGSTQRMKVVLSFFGLVTLFFAFAILLEFSLSRVYRSSGWAAASLAAAGLVLSYCAYAMALRRHYARADLI